MNVAIYCLLSEEDENKVNKEDDSNSTKNQKTGQVPVSIFWDF